MNRASIIYNPVSRNAPSRQRLERSAESMRSFGWEIDLRVTRRPGHATQLAREAAAAGASVVFACGGDGTLNEVVNGLVGSDAAVGVLRGGMGNVFAKEIGVPKSPDGALRCLVDGERRRFDLGIVYVASEFSEPLGAVEEGAPRRIQHEAIDRPDEAAPSQKGKYFLVMAGVGLDGETVKRVPPGPKRWLGSTSYVLWGLWELLRYRPRYACVVADGVKRELELYWLLVGNTRSYGGILNITRNAVVDDGLLDAYVFEGRHLGWVARTATRLALGKQDGAPGVTFQRVRRLDVATEGLSVQADGEFVGETPVRFGVAPAAIEVLLPRGGGRQLFSKKAQQNAD